MQTKFWHWINRKNKNIIMQKLAVSNPVIPTNYIGKSLDLEEYVTEFFFYEAASTFKRAYKRLLNPPIWHELAGTASASFKLVAKNDPNPHRLAQTGDYFRIDIPGPGPAAGGGYDWVRVDSIRENYDLFADESFSITLKASQNPYSPETGTAHFFTESATSTFNVIRKGRIVKITYHGRNEVPNVKKVSMGDKLRNSVIASGALAGLSELQWGALIKGLLQKEIGG
jgi:hypothetical protein